MSKSKKTKSVTVKGKAKGETPVRERQRVLFAEPPQKPKGRPFMAFRLDAAAKRAFQKYAKSVKGTPAELLRAFVTKVTGVEAGAAEGGEE
jgi:hypothetical protein